MSESLAIIRSNNGLVPVWRQAIAWTNADYLKLVIFSEMLIEAQSFRWKKIIWQDHNALYFSINSWMMDNVTIIQVTVH